ncbi:uncharacterized protein LOC142344995 [Convolutriloba macropyga]|uniref:uncharacterized protein LOC142344995 n=1 Tax=Convolutriloba macropyga TaxID=536237 RepID=UPI003F52622C
MNISNFLNSSSELAEQNDENIESAATQSTFASIYSDGFWRYSAIEWKLRTFAVCTTFSVGSLSVLLNAYIVGIFLFYPEFRKVEFYPLALNSFVDIFGCGIIVMISDLFTLGFSWNYDIMDYAYNGKFIRKIGELYENNILYQCSFHHLRLLLTQYCTGPCVLFLAFDRYFAVCWSTRAQRIMSRNVKIICAAAITLILISIYISAPLRTVLVYDNGKGRLQCDAMMYKSAFRKVIVDTVVFYCGPAFISLVLYIRVGAILLKTKSKQAVRNRNLTIALLFSTLYWIACWFPATFQTVRASITFESQYDFFGQKFSYYIFEEACILLLLSHAYINPIILMFVSRKFQQPMRRWFNRSVSTKFSKLFSTTSSGSTSQPQMSSNN